MLNKAILMGRLCADPELRSTNSGTPVCTLTLAVDRRGKDDGTDFIEVVAWSKTAEFVSKYFTKGQLMAVAGRIQTRNYEDKQGNKRKAVEVVADEVHFAESKKQNGGETAKAPAYGGFDAMPDDDEGLPF